MEIETGQMPATFGLQNPLPIFAQNASVIQAADQEPCRFARRPTTADGLPPSARSARDWPTTSCSNAAKRCPLVDSACRAGGNCQARRRAPAARAAWLPRPAARRADLPVRRRHAGELAAKLNQAIAAGPATFAAAAIDAVCASRSLAAGHRGFHGRGVRQEAATGRQAIQQS